MNLPLMLNRPKIHTKRIVAVDIERTQTITRLAQQLVLFSSYAEVRCIRCEIRECQLNSAVVN
jgi:uncharacterized protein (UPF0179 family)